MNTSKSLEAVRILLEDSPVRPNRDPKSQKDELNSFIEDVPQSLVRKGYSDHRPEAAQEYMKYTRSLSMDQHHSYATPLSDNQIIWERKF